MSIKKICRSCAGNGTVYHLDHGIKRMSNCPICAGEGVVKDDPLDRPRQPRDFLQTLRSINAERYEAWAGSSEVDVLFSGVELGEEAGEVLGKVKKLERERRGWRGSRATVDELADEIGDVIIVLDRIAGSYGIDMRKATADKFNKTSAANDFPHRMPVWPPQ